MAKLLCKKVIYHDGYMFDLTTKSWLPFMSTIYFPQTFIAYVQLLCEGSKTYVIRLVEEIGTTPKDYGYRIKTE